jgi:hypothetical protein
MNRRSILKTIGASIVGLFYSGWPKLPEHPVRQYRPGAYWEVPFSCSADERGISGLALIYTKDEELNYYKAYKAIQECLPDWWVLQITGDGSIYPPCKYDRLANGYSALYQVPYDRADVVIDITGEPWHVLKNRFGQPTV